MKSTSILLAICMLSIPGFTQDIVTVPVTFYLPGLESASNQKDEALYYYASLCPLGVADRKQAVLQIYQKDNVNWNTTQDAYAVVQVSRCENDFSSHCVIATNYEYVGSETVAKGNISWTMQANETVYFIRIMGQNNPLEISVELSFVNDPNPKSYPWSTNYPFIDTTMNSAPKPLLQYFKSEVEYKVINKDPPQTFKIGYCNQGETVKGINVAFTAIPDAHDYSLMQQWACSVKISSINDCTQTYAGRYYWYNGETAAFNVLGCVNDAQRTTADGIYVRVAGYGANLDESNTFTFSASQIV